MEEYTLGSVIKRARKEKGLTLRKLANNIGISHPYLSQLENGHNTNPSNEVLLKLSEGLDLSFVYLASFTELINDFGIKITPALLETYKLFDMQKTNTFEEFKDDLIQKEGLIVSEEGTPEEQEESLRNLKKLYEFVLSAKKIEDHLRLTIYSKLRKESPKAPTESLSEYMGIQKYNDNEAVAIFLDSNNEGNFYFFKENEEISEETQKKLRMMIKTILD